MFQDYTAIAEVLIDIEDELRQLQLWESAAPSAEAFASIAPFAVDVLTFPQWLQFIFIPRISVLLQASAPLPKSCGVAPMAEQYFSALRLRSAHLIEHLQKMDAMLTQADHQY